MSRSLAMTGRALLIAAAWAPPMLIVAPLCLLAVGAFVERWDSQGLHGFTFDAVRAAWRISAESVQFSLWIAALSAVTSAAIAVPTAYFVVTRPGRFAGALRTAATLPAVVPTLLIAMGLILALPQLHGGWHLLYWAFVAQAVPLALWPVLSALQLIDLPTQERAAETLGASFTQRFFLIVLPNVARPAAVGATTAFVLVLAESSASFFLASGHYQPFGVTLYNAFQDLDIRVAAATTMLLVAMLLPPVLLLEAWLTHPAKAPRARASRTPTSSEVTYASN